MCVSVLERGKTMGGWICILWQATIYSVKFFFSPLLFMDFLPYLSCRLPFFCSASWLSLTAPPFYMPLTWPFEGVPWITFSPTMTHFKDLLKQANVIFIWPGGSIKWLEIHVSLSVTRGLRMEDINHVDQDLCGHCGSLQTAAWDTNRLTGCWISAFELLAWLKTPVHFCVN